MPSSACYLPNGQTFTVTPIFGGVTFKSNDMNLHRSALPPGWTVIIHTSVGPGEDVRFTRPTLRNDSLYISYFVNPPSSDFKPASSPSRQIAMMLWATLLWYFHEPEPELELEQGGAAGARPDWRVNISRQGIFKAPLTLQKLERMGLVACEESFVGGSLPTLCDSAADDDRYSNSSSNNNNNNDDDRDGWTRMFVSRRAFWQIDPRIFLFTLTPLSLSSLSSPSTPSRRASPSVGNGSTSSSSSSSNSNSNSNSSVARELAGGYDFSEGPFWSGSHLPTFFPPPPTQYTVRPDGLRHPIRPKPPHQGETFYIRYVPSLQQYLAFRVPVFNGGSGTRVSGASPSPSPFPSAVSSDVHTLHLWMNHARASWTWKTAGPLSMQEEFLRARLLSRHSFPALASWDARPFGYFELFWVREDNLGRRLLSNNNNNSGGGGGADDYALEHDRGLRVLPGDEALCSPSRMRVWLSALVHCCWLADSRTRSVFAEPAADDARLIDGLEQAGFAKVVDAAGEIVMQVRREHWDGPAL